MSGTSTAQSDRRGLAAFLAAVAAVVLAALMLAPPSAAAATSVKAELSPTGVVNSDNPTGGSSIGVHPGDTVVFSASTFASAKVLLDKVGLGGLVGGLLDGVASLQVTANFSHLPGGNSKTVLSGKDTKSFHLPKVGKYAFTWSVQKVTVLTGLLGNKTKKIQTINLDGNQLKKAGVELNAKNQYVGTIVVAKKPPKGGISVQLPGVSVQPKAPVVGKLPKVSLPGVTTPKIPVKVPDLNPKKSKSKSKSTSKNKNKSSSKSKPSFTKGVMPVPAMVVPEGSGKVLGDPGGFQGPLIGGDGPDAGSGGSGSDVSNSAPATSGGSSTQSASAPTVKADSAGKDKTIDLASNSPSSSGLPVVLAMIAVLALVLVAGAYARLYLLRKNSST